MKDDTPSYYHQFVQTTGSFFQQSCKTSILKVVTAFLLPHICQQPPVNHINDSTTVRKLKTTNIRKQANYAA